MLIETLVTAFVVAYVAIAVFGHVLLLQAALALTKGRHSAKGDESRSGHAPLTGTRIAA